MSNPSCSFIVRGPDDIDALSEVAYDLRNLLYGNGLPPMVRLNEAPLLEGWCETLVPLRGVIGLSGIDKPTSLIGQPVFALSRSKGWARTLHGWVRLGRHVDDMR